MLKYIDAHAHLNFSAFDDDQADVIDKMRNEGIGAINVGTTLQTSQESVALAEGHEHIVASVGTHPTEAHDDFDLQAHQELIDTSDRVVAVGECGLDYYREANRVEENVAVQKQLFEKQIQLALDNNLPLILHMRPKQGTMDAYEDGLDILESYAHEHGEKLRGTAHFFVGDETIAGRFLDIGFHVSFTAVITLTSQFDDVLRFVPDDRILVETDAPFAAPQQFRGKRNNPLYVPLIFDTLVKKRSADVEELREQLLKNTHSLFSLHDVLA